jgi:short-subunit dehydrogenase
MNKLIVVTGGTKGIGRAIVEEFVRHGFDAVVCARNTGELATLKKELESTFTTQTVHTFTADMAQKEQVKEFAAFVLSLKRNIEVLVNNAGYFVPGEISSEPEGTLESMMDANVFSAYHLTRGLVPSMKTSKQGHVFNMCSIASIKAYANGGSYSITKFALLGFSKCLREELKPYNIRVTAIMPGATKTASWDGVDLPDERFMKPQDVAAVVYSSYALSQRSVVEEILIRPMLGDI